MTTVTRRAHGHRDAASARPAGDGSKLLTPAEVAAELRVSVKTLRNWKYLDSGRPPHRWWGPEPL